MGIGAVTPFLTVFVKKITHCGDTQAQQMYLVLMISTAAGVLPFGWLSDRIGPKHVLILGQVLIAIAALNPGLMVEYVANAHNDFIAIVLLVFAAALSAGLWAR